ncbi:MAG TPA: hypothetical protein PLO37_14165 [Candidatus Hydrogenedentes bacterium]|nr:hypothetical protein [Candidatus Hydrogenedentota bacterium]HPG67990.1 hypothetical protein [Candidatus Hydrogenedentota bacterium]
MERLAKDRGEGRNSLSDGLVVALIIVALAGIEPLTHGWIAAHPPAGTVATGAHTGDSAHHLVCMRMFDTGFLSPYATCRAEHGDRYFGYFALPFFLLYGVVGLVARVIGADPFLFLGVANGVGGALYLLAVYSFLRAVAPRLAYRSFLFFTLGGGLGGILFVVTGILGLHNAPRFEALFTRYAHYELIEGPHLAPALVMTRLYYTLPLALGYGALALFVRRWRGHPASRGRCPDYGVAALLFAVSTFINVRLGPAFFAVGALWVVARREWTSARKAQAIAYLAVPVAVGAAVAAWFIGTSPMYRANLVETVRMAMWLSPFVSATVFYWLIVPCETRRAIAPLPRWLRVAAGGCAGYLGLFGILYVAYQVYYGNVWRCLDVTVAVRMCDWALIGVPLGALAAAVRAKASVEDARDDADLGWAALWLVLFLAVAVSAIGQGWFMRFTPQRFMVFLGVPIALLAAQGSLRIEARRPGLARAFVTVVVLCGACSTAVAALCFQGPLGRKPGEGPFAYLHYEVMTPEDAALLDLLEPDSRVLTPPWSPIAFGEIVALRPGMHVVGGPGAMNIGDQPFGEIQGGVSRFFDEAASDEERRAFAVQWCVDCVYCPDTCPVSATLLADLRQAAWLDEVAARGRGVVFQVRP